MKSSLIFLIIILMVILKITTVSAVILTVDNKHPYAGDYQTLQAAHDAASPGDIIHVYPSMVPYNAITVTKQLTFYGVGFDITENIGEPFTPTTSISGTMTFNTGSEGSWLEGFDGGYRVIINTNNITVKRNDVGVISINDQGSGSTLLQNEIIGSVLAGPSFYDGIITISNATSILISNNIIINTASSGTGGMTCYGISGGSDIIVKNNIFKLMDNEGLACFNVNSSMIINNITFRRSFSSTNGFCGYNMSPDPLPSGYGNIGDVDLNTVFVNPGDYTTYDFHLLPSSPALGAGENGTDMGIYGSDAPYVDGGFPGLPSILQILAPTVGSQQSGLNIQFNARSNNE